MQMNVAERICSAELWRVLSFVLPLLVVTHAGCFGTYDGMQPGMTNTDVAGAAGSGSTPSAGAGGRKASKGGGTAGDAKHGNALDAGGGVSMQGTGGDNGKSTGSAGADNIGAGDGGAANGASQQWAAADARAALPRCVPGRSEACACTDGASGAQVCGSNGQFEACICIDSGLERIRNGMQGTWRGSNMNPWTTSYQVQITFEADGHYSTLCAQATCDEPVFYYGTDSDSPLKTYELQDIRADGKGVGVITIVFDVGTTNRDGLDSVSLSDDGEHLHFDFWHGAGGAGRAGGYGPVQFDLDRVH